MNTVIKRAEGTHSVAEYQRSSSSSSSENPFACFPHLLSQVIDNRLCGRLLLRNMISLFCTQQALFTLHRLLTVKKQTAAKQTLSAQNNRKLRAFGDSFCIKQHKGGGDGAATWQDFLLTHKVVVTWLQHLSLWRLMTRVPHRRIRTTDSKVQFKNQTNREYSPCTSDWVFNVSF